MAIPEPGTPLKWWGVKIQVSYFSQLGDPNSWFPTLIANLRPSVLIWDWTDAFESPQKDANILNITKSLATLCQQNGIVLILGWGMYDPDPTVPRLGLKYQNQLQDWLSQITPSPEYFFIDTEHTKPENYPNGTDVSAELDSIVQICLNNGTRFGFLFAVGRPVFNVYRDVYPVISGSNCPAQSGCTRTPESPNGFWELSTIGNYAKGFGLKCGLYHGNDADTPSDPNPGMQYDWDDPTVIDLFDNADLVAKIGVIAPNINQPMAGVGPNPPRPEFYQACVREANARGYQVAATTLHSLTIQSQPINGIPFTIT